MKDLTNDQLMYVCTLKILNFPIMAKILKECFKNDIDLAVDNTKNYIMSFLAKMPPHEAADLVLELERFPNTKEEFKTMLNTAFGVGSGIVVSMSKNQKDFDLDSKIIN